MVSIMYKAVRDELNRLHVRKQNSMGFSPSLLQVYYKCQTGYFFLRSIEKDIDGTTWKCIILG